jgi:HPt (histidine-containing phosphotransfer) domain-containing protein
MTEPDKIIVKIDIDLKDLIPGYIENRRKDIHNLQAAILQKDYNAIRFIGHGMKGSGSGYGFDQISELGHMLELSGKEEAGEEAAAHTKQLTEYIERLVVQYE